MKTRKFGVSRVFNHQLRMCYVTERMLFFFIFKELLSCHQHHQYDCRLAHHDYEGRLVIFIHLIFCDLPSIKKSSNFLSFWTLIDGTTCEMKVKFVRVLITKKQKISESTY